jgi:hypothetical protein
MFGGLKVNNVNNTLRPQPNFHRPPFPTPVFSVERVPRPPPSSQATSDPTLPFSDTSFSLFDAFSSDNDDDNRFSQRGRYTNPFEPLMSQNKAGSSGSSAFTISNASNNNNMNNNGSNINIGIFGSGFSHLQTINAGFDSARAKVSGFVVDDTDTVAECPYGPKLVLTKYVCIKLCV